MLDYDGEYVTWKYTPHGSDEEVIVVDTALDFLKKSIIHIPPTQFKMVRYYGIYATSSRQTKLKRVKRATSLLYKSTQAIYMQTLTHYRRMLMVLYNVVPIKCLCGQTMEFISAYFP